MRTGTIDRVDIDFDLVPLEMARWRHRQRLMRVATMKLKPGLERYLQVRDHYLALNSSTPSHVSGAPSSIS